MKLYTAQILSKDLLLRLGYNEDVEVYAVIDFITTRFDSYNHCIIRSMPRDYIRENVNHTYIWAAKDELGPLTELEQ